MTFIAPEALRAAVEADRWGDEPLAEERALAAAVRAAGWDPDARDEPERFGAVGLILSSAADARREPEETARDVADFLRVEEARLTGRPPRAVGDLLPVARRIIRGYVDAPRATARSSKASAREQPGTWVTE